MSDEGLITIPSVYSVPDTIDRLADAATSAGMRVFARIDHGAAAHEVDLPLRPTLLLLFGHPRGGTPLMQDHQTAGIDLPLMALAWEDADGKVWLTYNDAGWLALRHRLGPDSENAVAAIGAGLGKLSAAATGG